MNIALGALAEQIGATLDGDAATLISGLAALDEARPGDVSFVTSARYRAAAECTQASAVVVGKDWSGALPCARLITDNPDRTFADIARLLTTPRQETPGVHSSAVVAPDVQIGTGATIGPCCVIEAGAKVGARSILMAQCYIGRDAVIGVDCRLYPQTCVLDRCALGDRVILHAGAVVGSDGFGYSHNGSGWDKIPQIGTVEIGNDVEIGANVCIDRARMGKTVVGEGVKIDNLVQIAHNVRVGSGTAIAALVGVSGSTTIGRNARIGGQAGIAGHLTIGDGAILAAQAGVLRDVPEQTHVLGAPALPKSKMWRIQGALLKLPELVEKLRIIETRLAAIESGATSLDRSKEI